MQRHTTRTAITLVLALSLLAATDAAAGNCTAKKLKAAGKKAAAKLKCEEKAAKDAVSADGECTGKAETKFGDAFTKADAKPPCFATGDAAAIESKVDMFVSDMVTNLRPTPASASVCVAKKIKAVGKKAFGKLNCQQKAAGKGEDVDSECIAKVETKFIDGFAKAQEQPDCQTTGDASTIETAINSFVNDAVTELRPRFPSKCSRKKLAESGDKANHKLDCHETAAKLGGTVDAGCLMNAETAFTNGFTQAETEGDCLSTGDTAAIEAKIDAFVNDAAMALRPTSTASQCASGKLRETGQKTSKKLRCHAEAVGNGLPVEPGCLTTAEISFSKGFVNAEEQGDCLTSGDTATIEAKVDALVNDVVSELIP